MTELTTDLRIATTHPDAMREYIAAYGAMLEAIQALISDDAPEGALSPAGRLMLQPISVRASAALAVLAAARPTPTPEEPQ